MYTLSPHVRLTLFVAALGAAIGVGSAASAQCTPGWQPGTEASNVGGSIRHLLVWDADGPGGQSPVLVASGDFTSAGTTPANRIATWDGSTWSALGSGVNAGVYWATAHEGGLVVCGAGFSQAGGQSAERIARWDPVSMTWSAQGNFTSTLAILSVASGGPGKLYAVGFFTSIGGVSGISRTGQYDGATWSALGNGTSSTTSASLVLPNGDLIVGGAFLDAGELLGVNRIARWDGSQWYALGEGTSGLVRCLLAMSNGDIIVGGAFATAGTETVGNIARWDGTAWHSIGGGTNLDVYALAEMPNGDLVAAGAFGLAGSTVVNNIARWNGTEWLAMGSGVDAAGTPTLIRTMAVLPNGDLVIGGDFLNAGGQSSARFARWVDDCAPAFCDADWCHDGDVGVPDIFCFLSAWFALDDAAVNYGGSPGVPAIFAYLAEWFATPMGPCAP